MTFTMEPLVQITNVCDREIVVSWQRPPRGIHSGENTPKPEKIAPNETVVFFHVPGAKLIINRHLTSTPRNPSPNSAALAQKATQLYGEDWLGPLAAAMRKTERQVRRWKDGTGNVPGPVWAALDALLLAKKFKVALAD